MFIIDNLSFGPFPKDLSHVTECCRQTTNEDVSHGGLAGITLNAYELKIKEDDDEDLSRGLDSERFALSANVSWINGMSARKLRYGHIVAFCRMCGNEISVRYLSRHRKVHESLELLKYCPGRS